MSEVDVVKKHFEVSDSNTDGQLDSREWLNYMHDKLHTLKRDKKSRILRQELFYSSFEILERECMIRLYCKDSFRYGRNTQTNLGYL